MTPRTAVRLALGLLAASALAVGLWAGFLPRSFYDDFPGPGQTWVAVDGPYNEHLVRDVGVLNLALALVTLWAAVSLARSAVLVACGAWLLYGVPHLVYHVRHREALVTVAEQVGTLGTLALNVALPLLVAWTAWRRPANFT